MGASVLLLLLLKLEVMGCQIHGTRSGGGEVRRHFVGIVRAQDLPVNGPRGRNGGARRSGRAVG